MREVFVNFTRMHRAAFTNEVEQEFDLVLFSIFPEGIYVAGHARIGTRVHERLQRASDVAVVDEEVLFDVERGVATFKIAGVIVCDAMSQDQILCACRGANGIGLHETHLLERAIECGRFGKVPRDSVTAQVVQSDRQSGAPVK